MVESQEYAFNDLSPVAEFTIEVLDENYEPVRQVDFLVSFDGGTEQAATTDDAGTMTINATSQAAEMKVSFG